MRVDDEFKYQQSLQDWLGAQQDVLRNLKHEADNLDEGADRTALDAAIAQAQAGVDSIKKAQVTISSREWGQSISSRSSDSTRQVIYGEVRTGGVETFRILDEGENGQFLHAVHTFSTHPIYGFEKLYLDGQEVTFGAALFPNSARWANGRWANLVFCSPRNLGEASESANSDLISQSSALFPEKWTSAHLQAGCAHVYLILLYDFEAFPNGAPEVSMLIKGHSKIYDPRTDSTGYSNNAALVRAHYLTDTSFGVGFSWDEIDTSADVGGLQWAANICDQNVTLQGGGTEKRYTINGAFQISKSYNHKQVLDDMDNAMAGFCTFVEGKWRFYPGAWVAPAITLSEADLRSKIAITAKPGKQSVFSAVKGKYRGSATHWEWSDYPIIKNTTYANQDGERTYKELDLPLVSSPSQCERIAKITLEDSRQWITLTAECSPKALQLTPGNTVSIALERFGWSSKAFQVLDLTHLPKLDATGGPAIHVQLKLKETASAIYDWANGAETLIDLAPNTNLPVPTKPAAPVGLTLASGTDYLAIRSDGSITARVLVSWTTTTNPAILYGGRYEIQYQEVDQVWFTAGFTDGGNNSFYITDIQDGLRYNVRVRAITWTAGNWAQVTGYLVLGKEEAPSVPSGLVAALTSRGVEISWQPIPDLDLGGYELRIGSVWASATRIAFVQALAYVWPMQVVGRYTILLAARDTTAHYSDPISAEIDIIAPTAPLNFAAAVVYNMVQLTWTAPASSAFPIASYQLFRVSGGETPLGTASATIKTILETTAGTYTYRVKAVDAYGNVGAAADITIFVSSPPLFALLYDQPLAPGDADTLTNAVADGDSVVMSVNASETFEAHFDNNAWATPQDQVDDGLPIFIQPANLTAARCEWVVDFGETIGGCLLKLSYVGEWVDGSGTVDVMLGTSPDSSTWTDVNDVTEIFATGFRYARVRFDVDSADTTSIYKLSQVRARLEVKKETISTVVSCNSADGSGTLAVFAETVLDIFETTIQTSYTGTEARTIGYSVVDNDIRVFLYNGASRASGNVNVTVQALLGTS